MKASRKACFFNSLGAPRRAGQVLFMNVNVLPILGPPLTFLTTTMLGYNARASALVLIF